MTGYRLGSPGAAGQRPTLSTAPTRTTQRARYHAGALHFEQSLVRDLDRHDVGVRDRQSLMAFGRDLYRIARHNPGSAAEMMARTAAYRLRSGLSGTAVFAVLLRAGRSLLSEATGAGHLRRMTMRYAGTGVA